MRLKEVYKSAQQLADILASFQREKATVDKILERWSARRGSLGSFFDQIKKGCVVNIELTNTYRFVKDLLDFGVTRESIRRRSEVLRVKYFQEDFLVFPGLIKADGVIKGNDQWMGQVDRQVLSKIDSILCIDDNTPLLQFIDFLQDARIHFANVRIEVHQLVADWDKLLPKRDEVLAFHWPSEETYMAWESTHPLEVSDETSSEEVAGGSAPNP